MFKNGFMVALAGGVIGFGVAGLSAIFAKTLIDDPDLLVVAVAGGISTFVALVSIELLSDWAEWRKRRPPKS